MKYLPLLFLSVSIILSCNNNAEKSEADTVEDSLTNTYSWEARDSINGIVMVKMEGIGPRELTISSILGFLNTKYPEVQMQWVKTSNDTVYVAIPEATYLTQQMGSSGPAMFFAESVYQLTELPGIRFVNFNFEEGDHAAPDVLSRESFKDSNR